MRNARHRVRRQTKPNQRIAGHTKSRVPLFSFSEQNMLIQSVLICLRKALGGFTEVLLGHTFMSSIKNENKQVENQSINFDKTKNIWKQKALLNLHCLCHVRCHIVKTFKDTYHGGKGDWYEVWSG